MEKLSLKFLFAPSYLEHCKKVGQKNKKESCSCKSKASDQSAKLHAYVYILSTLFGYYSLYNAFIYSHITVQYCNRHKGAFIYTSLHS